MTELLINRAAFHELPRALFQLVTLTKLTISDTHIQYWDNNILQNLGRTLLELYLYNVNLSSWPMSFSFLHELQFILIQDDPLKIIPDYAFETAEQALQEIDVINAHLNQLPSTYNITGLEVLELPHNEISEITASRLSPSIIFLYLSYNKITTLSDTSFPENSQLISLDLNSNPISTVSPLAFQNVGQLNRIYLWHSKLTYIPLALASLPNLYLFVWISDYSYPISCPCPPPRELVQWYKSLNGTLSLTAFCNNSGHMKLYLNGETCQTAGTTSLTTAKSTT